MSATTTTPSMSNISSGKLALLITLSTELVFFATVLVAYAALRDQVNWTLPHTLERLAFPLANSIILLASVLTIRWSENAIRRGKQSGLQSGLLVTLLLGLVFVAGQIFEFNHAGMRIDDPSFGGVFFTLIGFHAVHVLAGIVFLSLNLVRANLGDFTAEWHEAVVLGNWFWYYVTAVWIVLFIALYLI